MTASPGAGVFHDVSLLFRSNGSRSFLKNLKISIARLNPFREVRPRACDMGTPGGGRGSGVDRDFVRGCSTFPGSDSGGSFVHKEGDALFMTIDGVREGLQSVG